MDKVIVRFLKGNGYFVPGNITQLDREEADKLLKSKHIVVIEEGSRELEVPETALSNLPPIDPAKIICPICGREFKTQQAMKAHKAKAHKLK